MWRKSELIFPQKPTDFHNAAQLYVYAKMTEQAKYELRKLCNDIIEVSKHDIIVADEHYDTDAANYSLGRVDFAERVLKLLKETEQ